MTQIPYPGKPYVQTHPDRLAVVARLFGHRTRDVSSCRMLEIGCGDATNLLGIASLLPDAQFVGIDLSADAIAQGQQLARQAGLKNVTLQAIDLCSFEGHRFDYIVAHGVYSWVPQPVRDALLKLCARALTPHGVAMISYATYPGGFIEQLIRAPLLSCASIAEAREFAATIVAETPPGPLRDLYEVEWKKVPAADGLFLGDQLEKNYQPVYFTQFIQQAAAYGLNYLAEAAFEFPQSITEQSRDFRTCRRFRQTILCRQNRPKFDPSALDGCYSPIVPCKPPYEPLLAAFAAGKLEIRTVPPPIGSSARATPLARIQAESGKPITNLLHHEVNIEDAFTRKLITMLDGRRTRHQLIKEISRGSEKVAQELDRILTMLADHALLRG
jgi:SAM-dependent methyltransferase